MSFELSNLQTMIIEIFVGVCLAVIFFVLQHRTSKKVGEMTKTIAELTKQKATREQEKKKFECQRIIENLQGIQYVAQSLKTFLTQYQVGDITNENLRLIFGMGIDAPAKRSVYNMNDAIGQLQNRLNDNSLRNDFLDYLRAFYVLPERILKDNQPQQEHQRQYLLNFIDEQTEKIQEFINRFNKEMDSS